MFRLPSRLVDPVLAAATTLLVIAGSIPAANSQPDAKPLDWLSWSFLLIGGAALAFRRRYAGWTVATTFLITMANVHLNYPYGPIYLYTMVAIYSVGAWRSLRFSLTTGAILIAAHVPWSIWAEKDPDELAFALFTTGFWLVAPLAVGIAVRSHRESQTAAHLEERHRHVYEERLAIAQEVHDVVGHSLAVISMNAGAALHVLSKMDAAPSSLEQSLRAIRTASGGALNELRSTLATFTGTIAARHDVSPGLALLPELVAATNGGGLTVTLVEQGTPRPLPATVDMAAYRIVQESLTNVVRHAHASSATVTVSYEPASVTLRVSDNGIGPGPSDTGSGLDSMRERARSHSGTLTAGPGPGGGLEVFAELPYGGMQ